MTPQLRVTVDCATSPWLIVSCFVYSRLVNRFPGTGPYGIGHGPRISHVIMGCVKPLQNALHFNLLNGLLFFSVALIDSSVHCLVLFLTKADGIVTSLLVTEESFLHDKLFQQGNLSYLPLLYEVLCLEEGCFSKRLLHPYPQKTQKSPELEIITMSNSLKGKKVDQT